VNPTQSPQRRLFVQASHYSVANLLTTAAGLISFPLMTRIFTVADYGVLNLISATLTVSVALGKIGVQHSIIRYRSEITAGKGRFSTAQLYSTTFFGMSASGLVVTLLLIAAIELMPGRWLGDPRLKGLFAVGALVIVIQVFESVLFNFLRADQETAVLMKYQVGKRYLGLALILLTLFAISRSLMAFYWATLATEALAIAVLASVFFHREGGIRIERSDFSRPLYRELLGFGIPMMIGYEMSGIILAVGDRYVIHGLIGSTSLGLYSAAYNLCTYVQSTFVASVGLAVMPLYIQMWDQKGPEETAAIIARSLRTYILFAAPVIAGLASVGPQLLPSLASAKYASAAAILPWVIAGMVLEGANSMVAAGLFIHRKTRHIGVVVFSSALLNLLLNLVLVPRIGIMGAAIATLVSYAVASCALAFVGRRFLAVRIPWLTMVRAALAALAMYASLAYLCPDRHLLTVAVRALVGTPLYVLLIALIDPDARRLVMKGRAGLRKLLSPAVS
jgi:O-antigen/teichoic acid export membrane protein